MAERRVAITGLGVVTSVGVGIEAFWQALVAGGQGVAPITLFDAGEFPCSIGGQLQGFSAKDFVPRSYRKAVKVMARDIEIAVVAADLAFRDSGIVTRGIDEAATTVESRRLGCNIGAGLICADLDELGMAVSSAVVDGKFDLKAWGSGGMNNLTPLWLLKYLPNMLACHVTIIHGAEGPSNTITCGDASGLLSIGEGARWIQRGDADVVVAGSAEAKLNPMALMRQTLLKRLCLSRNDCPSAACRPFDAGHDGAIIGEGGGLVVLEELDRAMARGARIYAEFAGFAAACDPAGIDITAPGAGSLDLSVGRAVADAGMSAEDVSLIVAHGTAVPAEDACEAAAWQAALGDRARRAPAVAITGATGSMFAGAGGVTFAAAAMALHTRAVPPAVNFTQAAPGCELNLAPRRRDADLQCAAVGAFTTGGQSAACVLKRYES